MFDFIDKKVVCIILATAIVIVLIVLVYPMLFPVKENYEGDTNQQPYEMKTPPITTHPSTGLKLMATDSNGNINIIDAETLFKSIIDTINGTASIPGLIPRMNSTQQSVALIQAYLWGNGRSPREPYNYGDLEGRLVNILGAEGRGISSINGEKLSLNTSGGKYKVSVNRDMLKKLTTDRWIIQGREGGGSGAAYKSLKLKNGDNIPQWQVSNNEWNDVLYFFPSYKTDESAPANPPMSQRAQTNVGGYRGTPNINMAQDA